MRLFFLFAVCLTANVSFAQQGNFQALLLDKTLTENANAVVRSDQIVIDLISIDEMIVNRKKVVTILNKLGNDQAMAYVGYDEGRKVKDIQAVIYDASGKVLDKIKENKFNDISAVDGSTLYSDSRFKYFHYTPVQYPYTLELTYEIKNEEHWRDSPNMAFFGGFYGEHRTQQAADKFQSPKFKAGHQGNESRGGQC